MSGVTWPPGLPRSLDYPDVPVGAVLEGAAARYGARPAFQRGSTTVSAEEVWRDAKRFANALLNMGIGRGDVVALHLPNRVQFAIAYFGTMLSGATFSPANPLLPAKGLAAQLADCGARLVVTTAAGAATISGLATSVTLVRVDGDAGAPGQAFEEFLALGHDRRPEAEIDTANDLAHIAYTGGTTGQSKGVELTHRNVVANILQYACWLHGALPEVTGGLLRLDQVGAAGEWPTRLGTGIAINLTPWFHAMGTVGSLSVPLLAGVSLILHDRFDPAAYLADAEDFGVTSISGAPAIYTALLAVPSQEQRDLSRVTYLSSGASPISQQLASLLYARFPGAVIAEGYGLTEATMGACYSPIARSGLRKIGSVGVPVFDTQVEIRDPDSGEPCRVGTPGEVLLRGPQVMRAYHNRPDDTEAVLREGWLRTGDIGVLDEDGYLAIVDRSKDMLIYKGYNIYPRELEELLAAYPGVSAAAVVGRDIPDVGEHPIAFVVAEEGRQFDTEKILATVNAELLPYKRVREIYQLDSLPVSAAGKILKRELRQRMPAAPEHS
jgi:long-chain acyl-CoA synthetase